MCVAMPSQSSGTHHRAPVLVVHPVSQQVGFRIQVLGPGGLSSSEDVTRISSGQSLWGVGVQ